MLHPEGPQGPRTRAAVPAAPQGFPGPGAGGAAWAGGREGSGGDRVMKQKRVRILHVQNVISVSRSVMRKILYILCFRHGAYDGQTVFRRAQTTLIVNEKASKIMVCSEIHKRL